MAFLYIVEFSRGVIGATGEEIMAPNYDHVVARQPRIAIGAGPTFSLPVSSGATFVSLHTDAVCSIGYGPGPSGVPANILYDRYAANETRYVGASAGNVFSVVSNS